MFKQLEKKEKFSLAAGGSEAPLTEDSSWN